MQSYKTGNAGPISEYFEYCGICTANPLIAMGKKLSIVDLAPDIGKEAMWTISIRGQNKLGIKVVIKNVEIIYGAACYTIEPVAGSGQARVREGLEIL